MSGVHRFLQAADIPGQNNFASPSRDMKAEEVSCVTTFSFPLTQPSPWPSAEGVRFESERSGVRSPLAPGFFPGRELAVT